jgi:hypothetical protein
VPQDQLVDELFKEIDKYTATKRIEVDAIAQAAGAEWLQRIEEENAGELTPERLAKLEAESARADADVIDAALAAGNGRERRHSTRMPRRPTGAASPARVESSARQGHGHHDPRRGQGARGRRRLDDRSDQGEVPQARVTHATDEVFGITLVRIPRDGGGKFQFGVDVDTGKTTVIGIPRIGFCE